MRRIVVVFGVSGGGGALNGLRLTEAGFGFESVGILWIMGGLAAATFAFVARCARDRHALFARGTVFFGMALLFGFMLLGVRDYGAMVKFAVPPACLLAAGVATFIEAARRQQRPRQAKCER